MHLEDGPATAASPVGAIHPIGNSVRGREKLAAGHPTQKQKGRAVPPGSPY